jgi:Uncharacterised protein family (UPF0158).
MKLTEEQIEKIAESIDAGFICHINPDTGEIEETRENDDFDLFPDIDDENYDEEDFASEPEWLKETRKENKEQQERIDSWERLIIIEKPDSSEDLEYMQDFTEKVIPETEQKTYQKALQSRSPFSNFNILIHDSEHHEGWHEFRKKKLIEYVREMLINKK